MIINIEVGLENRLPKSLDPAQTYSPSYLQTSESRCIRQKE